MTVSERNNSPDFFEDDAIDPVSAATGATVAARSVAKKKAGFYLSEELIERFNRHFHQMKLAGAPIENKSALLEIALRFALDDLEKGEQSSLRMALARKYSKRHVKGI